MDYSLDPALVSIEKTVIQSLPLASLAVGAHVCISYSVIQSLYHRRRDGTQRNPIVLYYTIGMLLLVIAWYSVGMTNNVNILVAGYENPTRMVYLISCSTKDHQLVQGFLDNALLWASDGLLLFRTWVVWGGNRWVLFAPCLLYVSSIGTGAVEALTCLSTTFGGPLEMSDTYVLNAITIFYALSVGFNTLCTALLAGKMFSQRRELRSVGMPASHYTSISSILIESAALYTVTGVVYIIVDALQIPVATTLAVIFRATAFLSPALIQLRMANGVAHPGGNFSVHLSRESGAIRFKTPDFGPSSTDIAIPSAREKVQDLHSLQYDSFALSTTRTLQLQQEDHDPEMGSIVIDISAPPSEEGHHQYIV